MSFGHSDSGSVRVWLARDHLAWWLLGFVFLGVVVFVAAFLVVAFGQLTSVLSGIPVQSIADQLPFQVPTPLPTSVAASSGTLGAVGATLYNVALLLAFFLLVSDRRLGAWFTTEIFDQEGLATDYFAGADAGFKSVYFGHTLTIFAIMVLTGAHLHSVQRLRTRAARSSLRRVTRRRHWALHARAACRAVHHLPLHRGGFRRAGRLNGPDTAVVPARVRATNPPGAGASGPGADGCHVRPDACGIR